jgi:deoxycytidylate deaminase
MHPTTHKHTVTTAILKNGNGIAGSWARRHKETPNCSNNNNKVKKEEKERKQDHWMDERVHICRQGKSLA